MRHRLTHSSADVILKPMHNKIDHFVIGADTLEQGIAEIEARLGVIIPRGGKHDAMSTHNCVMQSGNESFFELIAIDPDAPADPGRRRWFSLDEPETRTRLKARPRALCWVVGTDDLESVVKASPVDLGEITMLTRGTLSWRLTVPKDGHLPMGGLLPLFIQWPDSDPHPSTAQQNLGVILDKIRLSHPESEALENILKALQVDHLAEITTGDAALRFQVTSPKATVIFD